MRLKNISKVTYALIYVFMLFYVLYALSWLHLGYILVASEGKKVTYVLICVFMLFMPFMPLFGCIFVPFVPLMRVNFFCKKIRSKTVLMTAFTLLLRIGSDF